MYFISVAGFMLLFPLLSIGYDWAANNVPFTIALLAKWYVFWAVGVRLCFAGVKQISQPRYTAEKILGLTSEDVIVVVRELGFANFSIGTVGLATIHFTDWTMAVCLVGGLFYGLAGINHVGHPQRNALQNVAMISDLFASLVLLGCFISIVF